VLLCTAGCATAKSKALQAKLLTMARNPAVEADYRIAPPDSLAIEVSGYPEYSRSVTVRPDGRITVAPVGDVSVQGLTTTEAAKAVEDALLKELSQPRVTISLLAANSKAIYVLGEVRRQGRQPYYGDMTLIDVLGQAAGTTLNADVGKIKVTRASLDAPEVILINLRKLVYDGAAEQNIIIKEGDIVYVPPTGWAKVGYAVNQVLFPFRSGISAVSTYNTVDDAFDGNND
jgi:polysaccharide export outer membrane protein